MLNFKEPQRFRGWFSEMSKGFFTLDQKWITSALISKYSHHNLNTETSWQPYTSHPVYKHGIKSKNQVRKLHSGLTVKSVNTATVFHNGWTFALCYSQLSRALVAALMKRLNVDSPPESCHSHDPWDEQGRSWVEACLGCGVDLYM